MIEGDGSIEGPSIGGLRAELETSSDVERRFRVTFDGLRPPGDDQAYLTSAQVRAGAGIVVVQGLAQVMLVRVRPMGVETASESR